MPHINTPDSNGEKNEIEKALQSLSLRPIPPGLRARVLAASLEARKNLAMNPREWMAVSACALLIVAALLGDAIASRRQSSALLALARGPAILHKAGKTVRPLVEEISTEAPGLGARLLGKNLLIRGLLTPMGEERKSLDATLKAVERLKGRIQYELSENPD